LNAASTLLATVPADEFVWLLPLCVAIALVSSAAHRENMGQILGHAAKSAVLILGGLLGFMVCVSYVVEWLLA
jgi:hypothetical protein